MRTTIAYSCAALAALAVAATCAAAAPAGGAACSSSYGTPGYSYAGVESARTAHGIVATVTLTASARVPAGHVAGWVGVGAPGAGAGGRDQWLQAGLAVLPDTRPLVYVEVTDGAGPRFTLLEADLPAGASRRLAVLEVAGRPGWWRVWVDGKAVTAPIHLAGSSGRWRPIATAESWSGGEPVCNGFGFRFTDVRVADAPGGSWRALTPGTRFRDRGTTLRVDTSPTASSRALSTAAAGRFGFVAAA